MITFDTNILVYATASIVDARVERARDLLIRGMHASSSILLLPTLAEFSNVAWRKARIPVGKIRKTIDVWCVVLPAGRYRRSFMALEAVRVHRIAFWGAMLWASAQRAGVQPRNTKPSWKSSVSHKPLASGGRAEPLSPRMVDTDPRTGIRGVASLPRPYLPSRLRHALLKRNNAPLEVRLHCLLKRIYKGYTILAIADVLEQTGARFRQPARSAKGIRKNPPTTAKQANDAGHLPSSRKSVGVEFIDENGKVAGSSPTKAPAGLGLAPRSASRARPAARLGSNPSTF
jgi:predicted nucleic acid-binding protein